ncbi:MAG: ATP-binding cassette domain-containing protein [Streptosporangiales bacterium]|nr:ATP-binding cassette domain-containing protein [Streptosporangiales bacterium]
MTCGAAVDDPRQPDSDRAGGLSIRELEVAYATDQGLVKVLNRVSFDVRPGETLGVVGESGSGKTQTVLSVLGLIPRPPGRILGGEAILDGRDLLTLSAGEMRQVRGAQIGMVFQDPMTSLNPVMPIGKQVAEAVKAHSPQQSRARLRARATELLDMVGLPSPARQLTRYPHELSGGMRQRVGIAIAIANGPQVLIADEPTTALDVTIQAQVLEVLHRLKAETRASLVLITHDLSVIAEFADRVVVMYAGQVVECGDVDQIFHAPRHPYTVGLIASKPAIGGPGKDGHDLAAIPGQPPSALNPAKGCSFQPRCQLSGDRAVCREDPPELVDVGESHTSRCHWTDEVQAFAESRIDV